MDANKKQHIAAKLEKIARLAFNPAAKDGEAEAAVIQMVRISRKNEINFEEFKDLLGVPAENLNSYNQSVRMPFGKYIGRTLEEVFQENPGYLDWILSDVKGYTELKKQISALLNAKRN
jgi:uncharacterized protein (DUF3820 family)